MRGASILGLLALLVGHSVGAQTYAAFTFEPPAGMTLLQVDAIDNAGEVLGTYRDSSQAIRSLLRSANGATFAAIQMPGAIETRAVDVNNLGQIVGYYTGAAGTRSFLRAADGTFTPFDVPAEGLSLRPPVPSAMNDRGDVIGTAYANGSARWGFLLSADRKTFTIVQVPGANLTDVRGIDNQGEIVGTCQFGGSFGLKHGFRRKADGSYVLIDAPGAVLETTVAAMNNRGQIVANGGVLNTDGGSAALDPLVGGTPAAIDDSGRVAGCIPSAGVCRGFIAVPLAGTQPVIRPVRGVISASAFGGLETIAPGSWIEIYGSNLAKTTREWRASDFTGDVAPTSLDAVSVLVNGRRAFIGYVSPGQVNAVVPADIPPGVVSVTVTRDGQTSAGYPVTLADVSPAILAISEDVAYTYALGVFPDFGAFALPAFRYPSIPPTGPLPARLPKGGDTVVLYGAGFGSVSPEVRAGQVAAAPTALNLRLEILIGGLPARVTYAGLAPGCVGLFQFNIVVPDGLLVAEASVEIRLNGVRSPQTKLYLAVQP